MALALFEAQWDTVSRRPVLPVDDDGRLTLFDEQPGCGWHLVAHNFSGTPPTVTVLIATSATVMSVLKNDTSLLWLGDMGSPIHDEDMPHPGNQGVNRAVRWLRDNGYSGPEFGAAISVIAKSKRRREFAGLVLTELHGVDLALVERQHIG